MIEPSDYNRILTRAVILPLVAMALLAGLLVWQIRGLLSAASWVDHTDQVIAQANQTMRLMLDAATGQRGYLIGGKTLFLEPYQKAEKALHPTFDALARLVGDNPPQVRRVQALRDRYAQWDAQALSEIATRAQGRDYQSLFNRARGKVLMDDLRMQIATFVAIEEGLRVERVQATQRATRITLASAGALTLLLGGLLGSLIRRQILLLSASYGGALAQVQESEQRLSVTLTSIGDAVIATDTAGKITFMNPVAERLTGWKFAEAQGQDAQQVFHIVNEETRHEVESPIAHVLREGVVVGMANHTTVLGRDGTETAIDDSGAPIRDARGALVGTVLVFRDISERKAQERREQETAHRQLEQERAARLTIEAAERDKAETFALLDALMATAPIGLGFLDTELRYQRVNQALADIDGLPISAHLGHTARELLPELGRQTEAMFRQVLATGQPMINVEQRSVRPDARSPAPDGERVWLASYYPVRPGEQIIGLGLVALEITERKRQEAEILMLNAQLRRAMEETHHRVRNNLQIIAAMVDMQQMEHTETVPTEELQRLATHVRTLGAVHDILTTQAKKDGQAQFLSAKELLEKLLGMLQQTAPACHFRFQIEHVLLSTRRATSLGLIVNELVTNAIKYGKQTIEVTFTAQADTATLEVCDDGPGLPEQFDPVRSAHTGLSLVENLAHWDLRGLTVYRNRDSGGARVMVTLPIETPMEVSASA